MSPAATLSVPSVSEDQPLTTTGVLTFAVPPPDGEKPFVNINASADSGVRATNLGLQDVTVTLQNIRASQTPIGLDITGFQLATIPASFSVDHENFLSEEKIKAEYYPEIEAALLKTTGAKEIFIFDHTIRRRNPGVLDDDPSKRQPVSRVHVDQTTSAAINRVKRHLPEKADDLLTRRFQLINVWRPIQHPADDHPLAVGKYTSLKKKDLLATTLVYPDPLPNGETYSVAHSEGQEFFYVKGQTVDEVMFIKCFDTEGLKEDSGIALLTPHTAFDDPNTKEGAPLRQSIEVRCLVFY